MSKKSHPKPIKTKEGKYQCPTDKEVYATEKDYKKHREEKQTKKVSNLFTLF